MLPGAGESPRDAPCWGSSSSSILVLFVGAALAGSSLLYYVLLKELPSIAALKDYRPSITTRVYADNQRADRRVLPRRPEGDQIRRHPEDGDPGLRRRRGRPLLPAQGASTCRACPGPSSRISRRDGSSRGEAPSPSRSPRPSTSPRRRATCGRSRRPFSPTRSTRYLTKEEIITLYLNHIYLGHGTYGIEAASQGYFGKSASDLTLAEAAMLAGLPKAPSNYSPYLHPERAYQRQAYVLTRMLEDGYITEAREGAGARHGRSGSVRSSRRTRSPRTSSKTSAATSRRNTAATSSTRRGSRSTRR